ncbi:MAG: DUF1932 domain-containing protein [Paracoccaceae bacterium]
MFAGNKRVAAEVIASAGGRYVDVAIMAPVHPLRARSCWFRGRMPTRGSRLAAMGMNPTVVGDRVGQASTIKMLRSVMIKGIEALTAECLLAARRPRSRSCARIFAGQRSGLRLWAHEALTTLKDGGSRRRAAEMEEVGRTLRELGLPDRMATATAQWQAEVASLRVSMQGDPELPARRPYPVGVVRHTSLNLRHLRAFLAVRRKGRSPAPRFCATYRNQRCRRR